ncbi:hypothetical protein EFA69_14025 [Rufibacter immobilis]|uniref:S9 family peptidase n=1 Tax=Rufibacter immobilis TaxID=1348778 RepID=A0A3M9MPW5_9BACT|nr:PD40 domain-containing protein [Rufibacter immobilis]RNI27265.1 hypothetical protein EFA69_14025 [Rufibacter immobilis]
MLIIKRGLFILGMGACATSGMAQGIPDTEIFLVSLKPHKQGLQVGTPVNFTQRTGYDNQPSFSPDGKTVLYTSQRDGKQTDIYQYSISSKQTVQLTATPEAEYSPLVMPDGKRFSVVRGKEQHLWQFPLKPGSSQPGVVLELDQLIGYHVWYNQDTLLVAAFRGQPPMALYLTVPAAKTEVKMEESIGRSLHRVPGKKAISYLVPLSDSLGEIKQMDLKTGSRETIIQTLPGSQDFAWTPDGRLLMAQGAKLYFYRPGTDRRWQEVADFSQQGIKNITRLALSLNGRHLAFVATL